MVAELELSLADMASSGMFEPDTLVWFPGFVTDTMLLTLKAVAAEVVRPLEVAVSVTPMPGVSKVRPVNVARPAPLVVADPPAEMWPAEGVSVTLAPLSGMRLP